MNFDLDVLVSQVATQVAAQLEPKIAAAVARAFEHRVEGRVLDVPALAKRLGKSTDGARIWLSRRKSKLATVDLGGRVGVRVEDLDAYLNGTRSTPRLRIVGGAK